MNLLFEFKKDYLFKVQPSELKSLINLIVDSGDYGLDKNIAGELIRNNTYQLRLSWAPMTGLYPPMSPALLKVEISSDNNNTRMNTILKPNFSFIVLFYMGMLFFLLIAIVYQEATFGIILMILTIILIFGGIAAIYMYYLRHSFEKILEFNNIIGMPITSATRKQGLEP